MKTNEPKVVPFITFCGQAKEAVEFYTQQFPNSQIISIAYFEKGDRGVEGEVLTAVFEINGLQFMAMDMEKEYCPQTSWATSFYYDCDSENEFDKLFEALAKDGTVLMGPEPVETSSSMIKKCAWITDRFNMTWQLIYQ